MENFAQKQWKEQQNEQVEMQKQMNAQWKQQMTVI